MNTAALPQTKPGNSLPSMRPVLTTQFTFEGTPDSEPPTRNWKPSVDTTYTTFIHSPMSYLSPFRSIEAAIAAAKQITAGPDHPGVALINHNAPGVLPFIELYPLAQMVTNNIGGSMSVDGDVNFATSSNFTGGNVVTVSSDLVALVDEDAVYTPTVAANDEFVITKA